MPSLRARRAAASAVKAFLAEVAVVYLGKVYDHKSDAFSKRAWGLTLAHFENRCAYCHTPAESLPKGIRMTMEHLIEENQYQCGLHHPGNTVPACSACNGSRDKSPDGSRLTWEQHLDNLGKEKKWTPATIEKRRKRIQAFVAAGGYPAMSSEEMSYLRKTAQELYQDILKRSTAGVGGFIKIHGEAAVRVKAGIAAPKTKQARRPSRG